MSTQESAAVGSLIDTHCHLDAAEFAVDRDAVVTRALASGIARLVVPAVEVANFAGVRDCCRRYPVCVPAYGIHPMFVHAATETDLDTLRAWLTHESEGEHPPVALGEIGLDYFTPGFDATRQEIFFVEQLKIACDFDLPVLVHSRRAVDTVLKHLRRVPVRGGIAHAFNGSRQQADAFIKLGFKLGFGGAMTYAGSTRIRHLATTLPIDTLVLETDAPDIPPEFIGRTRNSQETLPRIAAILASLRGMSVTEIAIATSANALALLPPTASRRLCSSKSTVLQRCL